MSNSVLNNKFKKWSSLLAQNPDNVDYKNKVSKYGTLMVRAVQGGGNGEVDELLRKIDGVVRKSNMNGGGKQVTGYRNMRGGTVEESAKTITELKNIIDTQTQNSNTLIDRLVATLNKLVVSHRAKKEECEKQLVELGNQKQQLTEAQKQLAEVKEQLTTNTTKKEALVRELEEFKTQTDALKLSISGKEQELSNQISQLQQKITALEKEQQEWLTRVQQPLKTFVTDVSAVTQTRAEPNKQANALLEQLDQQEQRREAGEFDGGSRRTTRRH